MLRKKNMNSTTGNGQCQILSDYEANVLSTSQDFGTEEEDEDEVVMYVYFPFRIEKVMTKS